MSTELEDLLASGAIQNIDAIMMSKNGSEVVAVDDVGSSINALSGGIPLPELANDAAAGNGSIYWNIAADRLEFKTPAGVVQAIQVV